MEPPKPKEPVPDYMKKTEPLVFHSLDVDIFHHRRQLQGELVRHLGHQEDDHQLAGADTECQKTRWRQLTNMQLNRGYRRAVEGKARSRELVGALELNLKRASHGFRG